MKIARDRRPPQNSSFLERSLWFHYTWRSQSPFFVGSNSPIFTGEPLAVPIHLFFGHEQNLPWRPDPLSYPGGTSWCLSDLHVAPKSSQIHIPGGYLATEIGKSGKAGSGGVPPWNLRTYIQNLLWVPVVESVSGEFSGDWTAQIQTQPVDCAERLQIEMIYDDSWHSLTMQVQPSYFPGESSSSNMFQFPDPGWHRDWLRCERLPHGPPGGFWGSTLHGNKQEKLGCLCGGFLSHWESMMTGWFLGDPHDFRNPQSVSIRHFLQEKSTFDLQLGTIDWKPLLSHPKCGGFNGKCSLQPMLDWMFNQKASDLAKKKQK